MANNRKSLKNVAHPYLGVSSAHKGYIVKISWTSAPVAKITAHKDFTLDVIECEIKKDSIKEIKHISYDVHAGDVIYFAQSDDHAGAYYIARWNGHRFCCTCPSNICRQACHHHEDVAAYALQSSNNRKHMEEEAVSASSDTRMEYLIDQVGAGVFGPAYRVNGGDWRPFLDASGNPVEIEGVSHAEMWLSIVEKSSQVEADLWLETQRTPVAA